MDNPVLPNKSDVTPPPESAPVEPELKAVEAAIAKISAQTVAAASIQSEPAASVAPAAPPAPAVSAAPPAPIAPPPAPRVKVDAPPPAPAPKVEAPQPAPAAATAAGSAQRIAFVIEDDFDASEIFGKAMEANGLTFEVISTGNQALERLNQVVPDIVVLDMHLPNVDGTQILAHIRKTERLAKTLVIVVTADARVGDVVKADADLVVLKPATYTQVRDFAARLLRRHTTS